MSGDSDEPGLKESALVKDLPKTSGNERSSHALTKSPHLRRLSKRSSSPYKRLISPTLHGLADGAASIASGRPTSTVDSALVEAISRSVAEHLRMMSISARSSKDTSSAMKSSEASTRSNGNESHLSSQKQALKRFAKELHKFAEHTNAKGKVPNLTPSSRSPATLHTVSALLPYRREFKAAGLAVTSKDQAQQRSAKDKQEVARTTRRKVKEPDNKLTRMSQMDGKDGVLTEQHSSSEVSFINPGSYDEWRYALIDEVPADAHGPSHVPYRKAKGICFPCFPADDGRESIQENIKRSLTSAPNVVLASASQTARGRTEPPSNIPLPPRTLDYAEPSPRHLCDGVGSTEPLNHSKATGYRRPSMTISQSQGHLESCRGSHNYVQPDADIHKHNPRPTTTQFLHPSTAVRSWTGNRQTQANPPESFTPQIPRFGSRLKTGVSLPEFPFTGARDSAVPPPLRHTVGHLPKRPQNEKRLLMVRNPTEQAVDPTMASTTEKLFPFRNSKNRASASTKCKSRLLSPRRTRPSIPIRASSILQSIRSTELERRERRVTDREVLRGLHVATSAACDEQVDEYVGNQSGVRIRQFLADLVALETYWNEAQSHGDKEQRARHRRAQMRKLKQHMRQSKEAKRVSG